jgi:hypothetical protein
VLRCKFGRVAKSVDRRCDWSWSYTTGGWGLHQKGIHTEISIGYESLDVGFGYMVRLVIAWVKSGAATQWVSGGLQKQNQ